MLGVVVGNIRIHLIDQSATEKFGRLLGKLAGPGEIICLNGDLGAGKTTLSQAIAKGLNVSEACYVTSPSFALLHQYEGRLPMYHMDFYRLESGDQIIDLGFDEYFYLSGLTVIEWASRAEMFLPEERLTIEMTQEIDLTRTVDIIATAGNDYKLAHILKEFGQVL